MSARSDSSSAGGQPLGVLERLDVRAQARDRRAQLVAGVGDELALRLDRALERVERGVEAAREPAELVLRRRRRSGATGSGSPAISSVRRVKRSIGASAVRATTAAERGAERHAGRAHEQQHEQHAVAAARSTSSSGRATWIAPAAAEPAGQHAQVRAGHGLVASGTRPSRCGATARVVRVHRAARRARPGGRIDASRRAARAGRTPSGAAERLVRRGSGRRRRAGRAAAVRPARPGRPPRSPAAQSRARSRGRAASCRPRRAARRARRGRSPPRRSRPRAPRRGPPRPRCGAQAHGSRST